MPIETVAVETSSALAERARERPHHRNARVVAGSALGGLESLADDACRGAVLHSPPGQGRSLRPSCGNSAGSLWARAWH